MPRTISTPIRSLDSTLLPLPAAAIWPVLADIGSYPQWWPRSLHVRVLRDSPELLGNKLELRPFGGKAFTCRVVAFEEPRRIELEYGGFITGTAQWLLEPEGQGTRVAYALDVAANGGLVALAAGCIDLRAVHARSMRSLFEHLRRRLFAC